MSNLTLGRKAHPIVVTAIMLMAVILSAGCDVLGNSAQTNAEVNQAAVNTAIAGTVTAQAPVASPTPNYKALYEASLSATPAGQTMPDPTHTPTAGCMTWSDFKSLANGKGPYELIDLLDKQSTKKDHPEAEGKWRVAGVSVVWTGLYVDDVTLGGTTSPVAVDGKTGVWLVNGTATIPSPGGEICISGFDGTMPAVAGVDPDRQGGTISASACVAKDPIVQLFNTYKDSDPNRIYRELDQMADQNEAARLRFGGQATVVAKNTRTLVWAQSGSVSGPVLELDRTETKSVWLATSDGQLSMSYPFSGLMLCESLNPEADFPWWGK